MGMFRNAVNNPCSVKQLIYFSMKKFSKNKWYKNIRKMSSMARKPLIRPQRKVKHRINNINNNWLMVLMDKSIKMELIIKIQISKRNLKV